MIAKGKSISHLKASINYVLGREGAEVLDKNIVSQTAAGVVNEFKVFQQMNDRCERNIFSFVISPTISDGKRLSNDELEKINKSFLEKMDLVNHQYIAFVHKNTEHKHIHLYVNRIGYDGKAYNDTFVGKRSSQVAEMIAKEMGLKPAREIQQVRERARVFQNPEIDKIKELAKSALREKGVNSVSKFVAVFNEIGFESGFVAEAYHNKAGSFQGLRFYAGEHKFKASQIDRYLSKQNIEYYFEKMNSKRIEEKPKGVERPSMASESLNLVSSILHTGLNANRVVGKEKESDEEDKEKKEKVSGFEMGM